MSASKAKELLAAFSLAVWSIFTPIHTLLYIVTAFVAADQITGLYRALRNKQPITSARWRHTTGKLLGYYILMGLGLGIDTATGGDGYVISRAITVTILIGEALSLDENLRPTTGISISNILTALLDKLKPQSKG